LRPSDQEVYWPAWTQLFERAAAYAKFGAKVVETMAPWELRFRFKRPLDDEFIHLRMAAHDQPVDFSDGLHLLGALQDVSEQSRIEHEIARQPGKV